MARTELFLLAILSACGSGGAGDDDGLAPSSTDGGPVDARPDQSVFDANQSGCPDGLPADLGAVEPLLIDQSQTDGWYFVFASVSDEPDPVQQLAIRLYKDRGPFAGGVQPGSYTISGEETDYQWCDACVFLFAEKEEYPYAMFMAEAGVIHLESVGAELHGTIEHVDLSLIELRNDGGECAGPGDDKCGNTSCTQNRCGRQVEIGTCQTRIELLSF